jgi:glycosyltransferase involved in cell wall biosynthesis
VRILFVTPDLPLPARKGTAMRNAALLRAAAQRHDVALVSFAGDGVQVDPELREICRDVDTATLRPPSTAARIAGLVSTQPDMVLRFHSDALAALVRRQIERFRPEVIQIEGLELGAMLGVAGEDGRAATSLDEHNCQYGLIRSTIVQGGRGRGPRAVWSRLQYPRVRRFERRACRAADVVVAVSEEDASCLRELDEGVTVTVVPNGVDVPPPGGIERRQAEPPRLLFAGTLDYRPNVDGIVWFVREIWPRLQREPIALDIVGRDPVPSVRALAGPGVSVVGGVPSMAPYLSRAAAAVIPIRSGGGSRLKVLEAMAAGVPVVSTSVGIAGVAATPGLHHLGADDAEGFAQAVRRTLADPAGAQELARAARELVETTYDKSAVARAHEAALALAVRAHARKRGYS